MMKKSNRILLSSILQNMHEGKLEGGFERLTTSHSTRIFGGTDTDDGDGGTNNCNGGNCASGCTMINTKPGCSGQVNVVAGCGT